MRSARLAVSLLALLACKAEPATKEAPSVVLREGDLTVTASLGSGLSLTVERGGRTLLRGAAADALVDDGSGARLVSMRDAACLPRQEGAAFACTVSGLELRLTVTLAPAGAHLEATLTVTNRNAVPLTVLRLAPLVADAETGGALFLGADPVTHRILENGRFIAFDQTAQLEPGDVPRFPLGDFAPIPVRGNSASNWSHVIADVTNPNNSLVAGFLTFERAIPTLGVGYDPSTGLADDGRKGFSVWAAEAALVFHGKRLAKDASLASERLYLDPFPRDPLEGLERYATVLAAAHKIVPWAQRGPGHDIPSGWNSWSGGSSTGGYGQAIDETLILANTDVIARQLLPFGMRYGMVDDGWQVENGEWRWDPKKFPAGGTALTAAVVARGLLPGIWLAPFSVHAGSATAKAHPDWLMPREDGVFGAVGKDREALDLSNADARAYVRQTIADRRDEGFSWVKGDFSYLALTGKLQKDPSLTNVEAFRAGWKEIREALGPDRFLLGIGLLGLNVGVVDGMRLTLDDGPKWEEERTDDLLNASRSFKGTVRTGARRWFYGNRVWINHDDLIFFRAWPKADGVPPLDLEEARSFATWIGLGGGVVKLGDKLVDLRPEELDIVRRLLPAWPAGARPLDVLTREYPEEYLLHVDSKAGAWDVMGLFHWGKNRDWSTNPATDLGETPRKHTVRCESECLVYELWSETFVGTKLGAFEVEVAPRRNKVLALRKRTGAPQLLGTNRHVTMGATDLGPITWDAAARTLQGSLVGAVGTKEVPFTYHLAFHAPPGFTLMTTKIDGVAAPSATQDGEVVRVSFALAASQQGTVVGFSLQFAP